jgi:hypothetical protein
LASDRLKWQKPESDQVIVFTTNGRHFGYEYDVGATSGLWHTVRQELAFRPIGLSWATAEELVKLPTVAVVKEGCRQAFDELLPPYEALNAPPTARQAAKVGNYARLNYSPRRTVIAALPPGRRKYVKLFLKGLGLRNLDEIPTTIEQKPYDLGRGFLSSENREKLISLAPNIVLRDVP